MRRPSKDETQRSRSGRPALGQNAKTSELSDLLVPWYRRSRRRLPWRESPTPYAVWVSEVMLQQTRVETVVPYFERFLRRFPTLADLAQAPLNAVLALWSGLGYYRRARALREGARAILSDHGGEFPRDMGKALEIPGVGPYTAGAVLSIAYNLPVAVVDGNVERVLTRLFRIGGNPRSAQGARRLREIATAAVPAEGASEFNQALMELGATVCHPARPSCPSCPLERCCRARLHGDPERFPESSRGRTAERIELECGLILRDGACLVEKIVEGPLLRGLWVFPFVKGTRGGPGRRASQQPAGPSQRLVEEVSRKARARIVGSRFLGEVRHSITYRRITVRAYLLAACAEHGAVHQRTRNRGPQGKEQRKSRAALRWVPLEGLGRTLPVPSLTLKIARLLDAADSPS